MVTRDPDASFDTPNVVIGRQDRNELTLSFRPDPYLSTLLSNLAREMPRVCSGKSRKKLLARRSVSMRRSPLMSLDWRYAGCNSGVDTCLLHYHLLVRRDQLNVAARLPHQTYLVLKSPPASEQTAGGPGIAKKDGRRLTSL